MLSARRAVSGEYAPAVEQFALARPVVFSGTQANSVRTEYGYLKLLTSITCKLEPDKLDGSGFYTLQ